MTASNDTGRSIDEKFSAPISQFRELVSSSDALTFLMGAGCSRCAGMPLTNELTDMVMNSTKVDRKTKEVLAVVKGQFENGVGANIEDYLRGCLISGHTIPVHRSGG